METPNTVPTQEAAKAAYFNLLSIPETVEGKPNPLRKSSFRSFKTDFPQWAISEYLKLFKAEFTAMSATAKVEELKVQSVPVTFPAMPTFGAILVPVKKLDGTVTPLTNDQRKENVKNHSANLALLVSYCQSIAELFEQNPKAAKERMGLLLEVSKFDLSATFNGFYISRKNDNACVHTLDSGYVAIIKPENTDLANTIKSVKLTAYTLIKSYDGEITDYIANVHTCEGVKVATINDVTSALEKTVHKFGIDLKNRNEVNAQRKTNSQFVATINKAMTQRHKDLVAIIKK